MISALRRLLQHGRLRRTFGATRRVSAVTRQRRRSHWGSGSGAIELNRARQCVDLLMLDKARPRAWAAPFYLSMHTHTYLYIAISIPISIYNYIYTYIYA